MRLFCRIKQNHYFWIFLFNIAEFNIAIHTLFSYILGSSRPTELPICELTKMLVVSKKTHSSSYLFCLMSNIILCPTKNIK